MAAQFPHVILVSLDSLRQDYAGCYGYEKDITPNIDGLAKSGVRFARHMANSCWTLPSHASMLTGTYPLTHCMLYWHRNKVLRPEVRLISEDLKECGYRTFGVLSTNPYVRGSRTGYNSRFDEYQDDFPQKTNVEDLFAAVAKRIEDSGDDPCFVFAHVNACHPPFKQPASYSEKHPEPLTRYEAAIFYTDYCLGKFVEDLSQMGTLERTLLIITSDHGSERREHGFGMKEATLYWEVVDTVLIMHYPRVLPAGAVIDSVSESVDVLPTVLDIVGQPLRYEVQGKSLFPAALGRELNPKNAVYGHVVYNSKGAPPKDAPFSDSLQCELFSIRTKRFKFIWTQVLSDPELLLRKFVLRFTHRLRSFGQDDTLYKGLVFKELYDLRKDPKEQVNIVRSRPRVARRLEHMLAHWRKVTTSEASIREIFSEEESAEVIARLEALGYL